MDALHLPLLQFLHTELAIPTDALELALRRGEELVNLPMVLWQYGLISLSQLDQVFDWMEEAY